MSISAPSDISGLVLDLDPHVEAYQDAAGTTPASAGDPVGLVPDQSASGYDVSQSTTSKKPTLTADANGWLYLSADGVDDDLTHAVALSYSAFTIVIVAEPATGGSQDYQAWMSGHNYVSGIALVWQDSTETLFSFCGGSNDSEGSGSNGTRQIWYEWYDGATLEAYNDNTTDGGTSKTGTASASSPLHILNSNPSRPAKGKGYRWLLYNKALSSSERSDLYDYLDSLYSSAPPSPSSTVVPQRINRIFSATGSYASLQVQS